MCYTVQTYLTNDIHGTKTPLNTSRYDLPQLPTAKVSGFLHPLLPIQKSQEDKITWVSWGLIPAWADQEDIRQHTLNARIETLGEKPSFRDVQHNRCLVLVEGFYEWQWLDPKGKRKQAYFLHGEPQQPLVLGGLFSHWMNPQNRISRTTCTLVTREAVGLMAEIHNSKKRMPVILSSDQEASWLRGELPAPTFPLQADPLQESGQISLF